MEMHKVTSAQVLQINGNLYGIKFAFDDGTTAFAEVGPKATAEFYAQAQMGESLLVGVNPLLLSAEKAETLRKRGC